MNYTSRGSYSREKAGHPEVYYIERFTFMDYRGRMKISPLSFWGYDNKVITATHDISRGVWTEPMVISCVEVDDYAWITTSCILHDCRIGHHAIVSVGSVVNHMVVEPYTVVSGNPAQVIARWENSHWIRI